MKYLPFYLLKVEIKIKGVMDLALLATESASKDPSTVTVPVIQQRQNQASLCRVSGEVSAVKAMHASQQAESIKDIQILRWESLVP
jgi:hypothetical protein